MKMLIKKYKRLAEIINNRHEQSKALVSHQMKYCLPLQKFQQSTHLRHGSSAQSFIMLLGVMSIVLLVLPLCCVDASGYSYSRFVGPVSGPEHKIFVDDAGSGADGRKQHHGSDALRLDYVGKPEYDFAYGVEDAETHVLHNRNEMRDGDAVKGVYSLIDPDGTLRVVKYTADEVNGFRAEVERNKIPALHGEIHHDYTREPPPKTITYSLNDYQNTKNEYQHHYPQSHIHIKNNRVAYNTPANGRKPNLEQVAQNVHDKPTLPHIVYHYNKKYGHNGQYDSNDANGSNESDDRYHENNRPHYEVYEKPDDDSRENTDQRPQYKVHEKPDDDVYDEEGNTHKSNIFVKAAAHKKKKHHRPADDDDDDDDDDGDEEYYSDDDSEELDDFDEAVQATHHSEDSNEYY